MEEQSDTPSWWRCDTHGPGTRTAWGCPECVRELRTSLATATRERDEARAIANDRDAMVDHRDRALTAIYQRVDIITQERDEARAEVKRLITEVERLRGRLVGKRAIFQAGRDSYKTNCQPMNTDDEAWAEFVVSQEVIP